MGLNDGNNDGRRSIETKDRWLESIQSQHNTKKVKDAESLKAKPIKMSDIEYTDMPSKVSHIGEPGKASSRTSKASENTLGGLPKDFADHL